MVNGFKVLGASLRREQWRALEGLFSVKVILGELPSFCLGASLRRERRRALEGLFSLKEDPECNYLVKTNEELQESPDAESWRNQHHVSLGQNKFGWLPPILECSDLSTLLLQENWNLKEISPSFFQYMKKLKILDMCQTGIESLPSSISNLSNLKVLYLRDCRSLKQLNFAIQLPLLEVLDIRGSKIHNILTHTKNLEHLRRLWISFEKCRVENGTEVRLSQLFALEELVIHMESFDQWNNKVLIKDIVKEVASLEKLRSLQFFFPDKEKVINVIKDEPMLEVRVPHVEILQIFIAQSCLWRKFSHKKPFLLFIGCQIPEDPLFSVTLGYEKYIKYGDGEGTDPQIPEVLANVEAFELVNHKDIMQLSDFGRVDRALSNLQHLYLKDLPNMTNIWSEPGECGSLVKLKTLVLSGCPMLTTIFPAKIIQQLRNMESLTVENCPGAVKIFEKFENDGNGLNQLPKLKEMELNELPNLENIWADESSKCQSLKKLTLFNCPGLVGKSVQINAPNLESYGQRW
ncbi:putative disease resistance protein At4g19050 isoform X2 [Diospyros lotus]|uniref:putative disease resistance protein At4g19050 isoform X2 n=1 Tax=Diospyros lotus TaxID=55363 RepID=UPI00224DCC9E|nr:putative disease resistance protein At4g19050 isoform X2 [Diospyros lotus]